MRRYLDRTVMVLVIGFLAGCATFGSSAPKNADDARQGKGVKLIRIGGEEGAIGGFILPVKETFEEENDAILSIIKGGQGRDLADLDSGAVDAVVSTQPLSELVAEAAREAPAGLRQFAIGRNDMVVFLNKKNRVKKLTRSQLKAIFTGKIANWKQLGGPNRPIVIVWNSASAAENDGFVREVLKEADIAKKAKNVDCYEDVRTRVMETPGAIGIAPSGFVSSTVKVPKTPVVESQVIMVTKGEPKPEVKKLLELLRDVQLLM
jgi:phosphate transport system substrate-binding protein